MWYETKVIIIDKDFGKCRALKIAFPNIIILFCQFHIIKYLFKKVVDFDVPKDKRDAAHELIRHLVHAKAQHEYREFRDDPFKVMGKKFVAYFWEN